MSSYIKAELAATCSSLGRFHNGKYIIDSQCYESVRDIIRFLRRDDEYHEIRRYLGEAKVVESDLIHIVINCPRENEELFDITVRLLVNLTNPVLLLYREEIPIEKVGRNIYMSLIGHLQQYKIAFCNIEFWNVICGKLTDLFEIDWSERSEDNGLQIERMLVLLRNVLQIPADVEFEKRPENDITIHDKVLWALRQSQLLELLLYISSNKDEQQYYLHLLEIFSLILREQNPKLLAKCEIRRSNEEKEKDVNALLEIREREKQNQKKFKYARNFTPTFVLKDVKSISDKDVIYHKSLDKLSDLRLTQDKKRLKTPKNRFPVESERVERRSTFSVRLFLKEFCVELLNCSYNNLMNVVKDKLVSGRGLSNDESYYFWSLKFFLEFNCAYNSDIKLISECVNVQTFHFVQTQMESCFEHLIAEKKKTVVWVRRIHLILKAYHSLFETLQWMDTSPDGSVRDISVVLKSQIFYVPEYRELMLYILFKYDPYKFSTSYLRDLIETTHLFLKLLEEFCKKNRMVVQKIAKKRKPPKKKKDKPVQETGEQKWEKIRNEVYNTLTEANAEIPDIPPFDATLEIPIDDQKEKAMKTIRKFLHEGKVKDAIGLLRSARNVWPENDYFGSDGMSPEDEAMALQEICQADLGEIEPEVTRMEVEDEDNDEDDEDPEENTRITEQNFDVKDFLKRLVNKKLVEACGIMLRNYKKNTVYTNHCTVKLLFRIGWECAMPAMLYQASLFSTLLKILNEKFGNYHEINKFTIHLFRKFRENAEKNPKIFMELLFWKDPKVAYEIECGYGTELDHARKAASWSYEEEDELRRLWMECENQTLTQNEKIDWVKNNLINDSRSRINIVKKLKELMLIPPNAKTSGPKVRSNVEWTEEEIEELRDLYDQFKDAVDVAEMISERLTIKRTKMAIKKKLVEIGVVSSTKELRKKRSGRRRGAEVQEIVSDESSDDEAEDRPSFSMKQQKLALKKIENLKEALEWLKDTFEECIEDEDESSEGYPLLVMNDAQTEALENPDFLDALRKLGLSEPIGQQVYWKIPKENRVELHTKLEFIKSAIDGGLTIQESSESENEDEFETLRRMRGSQSSRPQNNDSEDEFDKLRRMTNDSAAGRSRNRIDSSDSETESRRSQITNSQRSDSTVSKSQRSQRSRSRSGSSSDSGKESQRSRRTNSQRSDSTISRSQRSARSRSRSSETESQRSRKSNSQRSARSRSRSSSNSENESQRSKKTNSQRSDSTIRSQRSARSRSRSSENESQRSRKTNSQRSAKSRSRSSSNSENESQRSKKTNSQRSDSTISRSQRSRSRSSSKSENESQRSKKTSSQRSARSRSGSSSDSEKESQRSKTTSSQRSDSTIQKSQGSAKGRSTKLNNSRTTNSQSVAGRSQHSGSAPDRTDGKIDSDEENRNKIAKKKTRRIKNIIDSDVSEDEAVGNGKNMHSSDSENSKPAPKVNDVRRSNFVGSEESEASEPGSEGNNYRNQAPIKSKRRRCIGSDSEMEEDGSGEEMAYKSEKVHKRAKVIDSDSDFEDNNSLDDNDTNKLN